MTHANTSALVAIPRRWALLTVVTALLISAALLPTRSDAQEPAASTAAAAPQQPQIKVGDLSFKVLSLRVSTANRNDCSAATISLEITNEGPQPKAVNFVSGSTNFVNDLGYMWVVGSPGGCSYNIAKLTGLPVADGRQASSDVNLEPGTSTTASMTLQRDMERGQTIGSAYDLQFIVATYKDLGEGKVLKERTYPVQFVNLQRSSVGAQIKGDLDGLGKALGSLFK